MSKKVSEKYFYTAAGIKQVFYGGRPEYDAAMALSSNNYVIGFMYDEEAQAFSKGTDTWDKYLKENIRGVKTDADAIVYADGSFDEERSKWGLGYASYGLIIFFRDGSVVCESGCMEDVEEAGKFKFTRYDETGRMIGSELIAYEDCYEGQGEEEWHKFVKPGRNITGEAFGAMRGLEICIRERGLKKIQMVCDCDEPKVRYENGGANLQTSKAGRNVVKYYGDYVDKLKEEANPIVEFVEVRSHSKMYGITHPDYPHGVYNDLVDVLAKAETVKIPIKNAENFNLTRALPGCEFKGFGEVRLGRRAHARDLYQKVLGRIKPEFV